jgi:hypothetical protein
MTYRHIDKTSFDEGITGKRKRGRSRSKWMQMVERDLNEVGMAD